MATLVLGALGSAIGGGFGGAILGLSGSVIGGAIGTMLGQQVDAWALARLQGSERIEGARLDSLRVTASTEGAVLPQLYGRMRTGGNIIWATDFLEEITTRKEKVSKYQKVKITEYDYSASFAVALCEGPIAGIGRIWADGEIMDLSDVTWRWYPGDEAQMPDPLIEAAMGAGATPAYRGTAYVVFEALALEAYGNRLPQLSFEIFAPLAADDAAEGLVRAVTMIPGSGEFAYATGVVQKGLGAVSGESAWDEPPDPDDNAGAENENVTAGTADMMVSLDQLEALAPAVASVSLVVSWFGDDLRAGSCTIRPKVEQAEKLTSPAWSVNGLGRGDALVVSDSDGGVAFGGTPADVSVVQAITEMKARGLRVTFYPFAMMDIPSGNTLPNPYSDHAAGVGQPVYPWRGRITCSPAAGFDGTVDQTATAAAQVADFFGSATPEDFAVSGSGADSSVTWTGGADWGYRRMILHYAHLCAAAGGVDAFLIGSELRGLTTIRSDATTYPTVAALIALAQEVRAILGPETAISYAADWSEFFGHQPGDGSGDVFFHLDPLWADPEIGFVGIDNYMPLSDWRDGFEHLDAQAGWPAIYDRAYLQANIEGGEGFDWYYASTGDRAAQIRTPISDGAYAKPWVFRYKDLRGWWSNAHVNRPGGVEAASPTAWVPQSKPFRFTEYGCPAIDRGTNQPNVFVDPKSSESFVPYFSRGWRDDAIQRAYLEAVTLYWGEATNNPVSSVYGEPMLDLAECAAWTWDARAYPNFPGLTETWTDAPNWRLGHWLTGRLGAVSLGPLVRHLCGRAGLAPERIDISGLWGAVEGYVIPAMESPRASIGMLARHFGFDAVESEGQIRFVMRGSAPSVTLTPEDMVAGSGTRAEPFELTRAQETELPQALKWTLARADEDYDAAQVEARRVTARSARIAAEAFPFAVPPEEAERRVRRALAETWAGRESAGFALPPSRLALDPTDVIALDHDGRARDYRILTAADAGIRRLQAVAQDRDAYELPPGLARAVVLNTPVSFTPPSVAVLDIPQLVEDRPAHQPLLAAWAAPWPGTMAVWRSPSSDGFAAFATFSHRAQFGQLTEDLAPGSPALWYRGGMVVEFASGSFGSVEDLQLFAGENLMALEVSPGQWELIQAGEAELVSPRTYRLGKILRGQRGTEWLIDGVVAAGARLVVIDSDLISLPVLEADLGVPWNYRVGPASKAMADGSYSAGEVTAAGVGLLPFAPVHVAAVLEGSGDIALSWIRRDRALSADTWSYGEVPMSEASEAYRIDILEDATPGAAVLRSIEVTAPAATYTAAQQSADFGAPLTVGDSLTLVAYQVSATLGPGFPNRATVML